MLIARTMEEYLRSDFRPGPDYATAWAGQREPQGRPATLVGKAMGEALRCARDIVGDKVERERVRCQWASVAGPSLRHARSNFRRPGCSARPSGVPVAAIIRCMLARGRIGIRTARENVWVLIEISDDGPDVPEGVEDRVFEPFFTTKDAGTGTGLDTGPRVVVEQHGGDIHFQVRLPMDGPLDGEAPRELVRLPEAGQ